MPEVGIKPDAGQDPAAGAKPEDVKTDATGAVITQTDDTPKAPKKAPWEELGFANPEAMAKSYQELRAKLSGKKDDQSAPKDEGKKPDEKPADGAPAEPTEAEIALAEKIAKEITDVVGGAEEYARIQAWAKANLSADEIAEYDEAIEGGKKSLAKLAVAGLKARYDAANGTDGRLADGEGAPGESGVKPFRSQAEVIAAMSDRRYKTGDTAYINEVVKRLAKSEGLHI